jgi:uncharacterized Zn-finger protein
MQQIVVATIKKSSYQKNVALRSLSLQVVFCRYWKTVAVAENNMQACVSPKVGHPKIYLPVDPLQKTVVNPKLTSQNGGQI